jgi:hypothetical protein
MAFVGKAAITLVDKSLKANACFKILQSDTIKWMIVKYNLQKRYSSEI